MCLIRKSLHKSKWLFWKISLQRVCIQLKEKPAKNRFCISHMLPFQFFLSFRTQVILWTTAIGKGVCKSSHWGTWGFITQVHILIMKEDFEDWVKRCISATILTHTRDTKHKYRILQKSPNSTVVVALTWTILLSYSNLKETSALALRTLQHTLLTTFNLDDCEILVSSLCKHHEYRHVQPYLV